jgi:hypothetical protein
MDISFIYAIMRLATSQVNGWWEWSPATITREIAVKNRSHKSKIADTKLQSFFIDLTGHLRPASPLV